MQRMMAIVLSTLVLTTPVFAEEDPGENQPMQSQFKQLQQARAALKTDKIEAEAKNPEQERLDVMELDNVTPPT